MEKRITHRQKLFARRLVFSTFGNATKAAILAGYSPRSARQIASRLQCIPVVNWQIEVYRKELIDRFNGTQQPEEKPRPAPLRTRMTAKQAGFMFSYMFSPTNGNPPMNGTQAAINAGYSPKTARVKASQLLKSRPEIAHYVGERETLKRLRDKACR